jgi:putative endonuclease
MCQVYALYNAKHKKIYIGQTKDLEVRLKFHLQPISKRAYTGRLDGKWVLIYSEEVENRQSALKREKQLKSFQGRKFIKQHIPGFRRLADQR